MKLSPSELAAVKNAEAALAFADNYLTALGNKLDADMAGCWGPTISPAKFFEQLGLDARRTWQNNGIRIDHFTTLFVNDAMQKGATLEAAQLAVWARLPKPAKIVAFLPDNSARVTAVAFPTTAPLSVWSIEVASEEALAAMSAGDIAAALTAAQP